jgi:hypothetical protein
MTRVFQTLRNITDRKIDSVRTAMFYAVYFSVSLMLLFNPAAASHAPISRFTRIVSVTAVNNISAEGRIHNFMLWFLVFAVIFSASCVLVRYLFLRLETAGEEGQKVRKFLTGFSAVTLVCLVFQSFAFVSEKTVWLAPSFVIIFFLFSLMLYGLLGLDRNVPALFFIQLCCCGAAAALVLTVKNNRITALAASGGLMAVIVILCRCCPGLFGTLPSGRLASAERRILHFVRPLLNCLSRAVGSVRGIDGLAMTAAVYISAMFSLLLGAALTGNFYLIRDGIRLSSVNPRSIALFVPLWLVLLALFYRCSVPLAKRLESITDERTAKLFRIFIGIAAASLLCRMIFFFQARSIFYLSSLVLFLFVLADAAYIWLDVSRYCDFGEYFKLCLCALSAGSMVCLFLGCSTFLLFLAAALGAAVLFCRFCGRLTASASYRRFSDFLTLSAAFLPLCMSFSIEVFHILLARKIMPLSAPHGGVYVSAAALFCTAASSVLCGKRCSRGAMEWKRFAYPALLMGLSSLSMLLPFKVTVFPNIFEDANAGVLISDFFNSGAVPLIEHYGGHMMSEVWSGLLYGVLNNDFRWAAFAPFYAYLNWVLVILLFFYFLKNLYDDETALCISLFFPYFPLVWYWGMGLLVFFAAMAFVKNSSCFRSFVFWLSVFWCALYRLDLGFSFALAGTAALVLYILSAKKWGLLKTLFLPLLVLGAVLFAAGSLICTLKGISVISRIREFLAISLSNENWAYTSVGTDVYQLLLAYLLTPFLMIPVLIGTLRTILRSPDESCRRKRLFLLMLVLAYFVNFQRSLVRHSVLEYNARILYWDAFAVLLFLISKVRAYKKFFTAVSLLLLVSTYSLYRFYVTPLDLDAGSGYLTVGMERIRNAKDSERVAFSDEFVKTVEPFQRVVETLLENGETFVDFINRSLLYPVLNRRSPVYAAQSPAHLSGEYAQECFVRQIRGVPIVLMPADGRFLTLDSVSNFDRYYKAVEYIYQHYVPLCKYDDLFTVWCLPGRLEEYRAKLEPLIGSTPCSYINGDYGTAENSVGVLHIHDLLHLPRIWAEHDERNAADGAVLSELKETPPLWLIGSPQEIDRQNGNYLQITADYDGSGGEYKSINLFLGTLEGRQFFAKSFFHVTLRKGAHNYLIRVSSDYAWYSQLINAVYIQDRTALSAVTMKILAGD